MEFAGMSEASVNTMQTTAAVINESRIRVRYAETDQMGVVYHANHFIWFEVGRVELLRQLGFSYKDMEQQDNCFIAVVDARCRYKSPARYDDEIIVKTLLKNIRESVIHFGYELLRVDDSSLIAEGETTHIVADAQMRKTVLPEKYMKAFREATGR
jgi:acyl-CoA thioester hydrolase